MRTVIYARVSTKDKGQSIDMQLEALKPFIESRGWTLQHIYSDTVSGSKESREGLDKLMADAKKRKFDCVCVFAFDRFARSLSHLVRALDDFQALGIQFFSYTQTFDTTTPMGKAMFGIIGTMAELERSLIRERVSTRVRQLIAAGKPWGAKPKVWDRDAALKEISEGATLRPTAKKYGVSHMTLKREAKKHATN